MMLRINSKNTRRSYGDVAAAIARRVGYLNPETLRRQLKRRTSMTLTELRAAAGVDEVAVLDTFPALRSVT